MTRLGTSHPSNGDLLRYADGEVSAREAKTIQSHLAACWECRTELAEIQQAIGECVHYRQAVLRRSLPDPPAPWFDIRQRLAEIDRTEARRQWPARLWAIVRRAAAQPQRWAAATALVLIVAVIVDQLRNAPSVRAAELLERASAAAESRPKTPRRIQIRTSANRVTRVIGDASSAGGPGSGWVLSPADARTIESLRPRFERARYNWEDPLSATSFAAWRNTLAEKRDEITTVRDRRAPEQKSYRIRTTTSSGELVEATLQLTADELRPVEGMLRFRDREWVEMTEIEGAPIPPPEPAKELRVSARPAPPAPAAAEPVAVEEAATPGDELRVFALLRRLGADLGEPVEVSRDGGQVVVSGVGVTPELGQQIHSELTGRPRVAVRFWDPVPAPTIPRRRAVHGASRNPQMARLQSQIEKQLGGRTAYEQFSDEVLAVSDALMSRVHALRRLAEHFEPQVEAQLAQDERQILARLRREHAVAVAGLAAALEQQSRSALGPLETPATPAREESSSADSWQASTEELFSAALRAEGLLAAMLGGAASGAGPDELPAQVLASVATLRAKASEYARHALK